MGDELLAETKERLQEIKNYVDEVGTQLHSSILFLAQWTEIALAPVTTMTEADIELLTAFEKTKLNLVLAYAINSLYFGAIHYLHFALESQFICAMTLRLPSHSQVYMRSQGIDPLSTAIMTELNRVQAYFAKLQAATSRGTLCSSSIHPPPSPPLFPPLPSPPISHITPFLNVGNEAQPTTRVNKEAAKRVVSHNTTASTKAEKKVSRKKGDHDKLSVKKRSHREKSSSSSRKRQRSSSRIEGESSNKTKKSRRGGDAR